MVIGVNDAERDAKSARDGVQGSEAGLAVKLDINLSFCPYGSDLESSHTERQRWPAAERATNVARGQKRGDP